MCCLALSAGFIGPRFALLLWWIFGDKVDAAFSSFIWPFLGLALPALDDDRLRPRLGAALRRLGAGWLLVALGLFGDIATYSSKAAKARYAA